MKIKLIKNYIICAGILILLVIIAFLLPHFIFAIGDEYRENTFTVAERENLDISKLNLSYEKNDYKRLCSYAEGLTNKNKYYVAEMDYQDKQGISNILSTMFYDNYMLASWTGYDFIPYDYYESDEYKILNSKRYIVYDTDLSHGVQLILWSFEIEYPSGNAIRLIVDAQTEKIYYYESKVYEDTRNDYLESVYGMGPDTFFDVYRNTPGWVFSQIWYSGVYYGNEEYAPITYWVDCYDMMESHNNLDTMLDYYLSDWDGGEIDDIILKYQYFREYYIPKWEVAYQLDFQGNGLNWTNTLIRKEHDERTELDFAIGLSDIKKIVNEVH